MDMDSVLRARQYARVGSGGRFTGLERGLRQTLLITLAAAVIATGYAGCRKQGSEDGLQSGVLVDQETRTETKIAFVSDRDGNEEIYVMNEGGTEQTNLTRHPADDRWPAWSPDGKKIAFTSFRDGNREIYVMNADGTAQRNLTNNAAEDLDPSWSPDGKTIAFCSYRGSNGNPEICVMNADGRRQRQLTNNLAVDWHPCWSPDGKRIAFVSDRVGDYEIYVMDADGSGPRDLSCHPGDEYEPSWSPDGIEIAFIRYAEPSAICVMYADGSEQKQLTNVPARWQADHGTPSWSPDGKKIAFCRGIAGNGEVYVINADGTEPRNLTKNPTMDFSPCWSPFMRSEIQ